MVLLLLMIITVTHLLDVIDAILIVSSSASLTAFITIGQSLNKTHLFLPTSLILIIHD